MRLLYGGVSLSISLNLTPPPPKFPTQLRNGQYYTAKKIILKIHEQTAKKGYDKFFLF